MTDELTVPFGLDKDGRLVTVDKVPRGLDCECTCPECKTKLVAVKGESGSVVHHFRHHAEQERDCIGCGETSLHLYAKQVICEALWVRLPDTMGEMIRVEPEQTMGNFKPDVIAYYQQEPVAIEVRVTHAVPQDKLEKIVTRDLATVEIDISNYYGDRTISAPELKRAILQHAKRWWLHPPRWVRERNEARTRAEAERVEAERRAAIEHLEAAHRAEEERRKQQAERLAAIEHERREAMARIRKQEEEDSERRRIERLQREEALARQQAEEEERKLTLWATALTHHPELRFYKLHPRRFEIAAHLESGQPMPEDSSLF